MLGTEGLELMVVPGASTQTAAAVLTVVPKVRQVLMELTILSDVVTEAVAAQGMRVLLEESAATAVCLAAEAAQAVVDEVIMVKMAAQAEMAKLGFGLIR